MNKEIASGEPPLMHAHLISDISHTCHLRVGTIVSGVPGFLAVPTASEWKSAVVVVGATGLDDHVVAVCRELAVAGHGALAIDLPVNRLDERASLAPAVTRTVSAALACLRGAAPAVPPRFGVVGYGAGGLVALAAGIRCQIGAAVSFYGEGPMLLRQHLTQIIDAPKRHAAPFLCLLGSKDTDVGPQDLLAIRDRLDSFGMRHTFIVYPRTAAGFCHQNSANYRAAEANDAWSKLLHALETAPRLRHRFGAKQAGNTK